jgi:transposase-like protein
MADESNKAKRGETREFWEAAVRLWAESGRPVRDFCNREGLTEHTFYSWRRTLMPNSPTTEANQEPTAVDDGKAAADDRRQRRLRPVAGVAGKNASAVEFLPVRVVGDEVSHAHATAADAVTGPVSIEIVGASPWRVRIVAGFDPTTLAAVLAVLERRPC